MCDHLHGRVIRVAELKSFNLPQIGYCVLSFTSDHSCLFGKVGNLVLVFFQEWWLGKLSTC